LEHTAILNYSKESGGSIDKVHASSLSCMGTSFSHVYVCFKTAFMCCHVSISC